MSHWKPPQRTAKITAVIAAQLRKMVESDYLFALRVRDALALVEGHAAEATLTAREQQKIREDAIKLYAYVPTSLISLMPAQQWINAGHWEGAPPQIDDDDRLTWATFADAEAVIAAIDQLAPRSKAAPALPHISLAMLAPNSLNGIGTTAAPALGNRLKLTGVRLGGPFQVTPPVSLMVSLSPIAYNQRTEEKPCRDSCNERDARAWRMAARRWVALAKALRGRLVEVNGSNVLNWPQAAQSADLALTDAQKLLATANESLQPVKLPVYVTAQKEARLAVQAFQAAIKAKTGSEVSGLLVDLVDPTVGRWAPVTGGGSRTVGKPCTGILGACTDFDVHDWEAAAKSLNGTAGNLRDAVVLVFGADKAKWPPLVQQGEVSYREAQELLNGDVGWSDSERVYSYADAQALIKDALETWALAIEAKTGKKVDYEAPDPAEDPESADKPYVPKLPTLPSFNLGTALAIAGVAAVVVGGVVVVKLVK